MVSRKIRLTTLIIGGFILAIVGLIWIYFFDVTVKTEVKWLYVGLFFGIVSGVLSIFGGYLSNDEETIRSTIVLSIALALDITFLVFLFIADADPAVIKAAKMNKAYGLFRTINIIAMISSILGIVVLVGGITLDVIAKIISRRESIEFAKEHQEIGQQD